MAASLQLPGGLKTLNPQPEISRYYNNAETAYITTAQVISEVIFAARYVGQTFLVGTQEYWFNPTTSDGDLKIKQSLSNSITGTGTINTVSKWSSISALTDSNIFDNGTLVTISSNTNVIGSVTGNSFVKLGGTISQFLKANGSIDGTSYQDTTQKGVANGYASLDATGLIPITQLPPSAIERLVIVADQAARFALTTATVQNGDTVKQNDTQVMYLVKDQNNLSNDNGYETYKSGIAASVPWSGVANTPTTILGYGITDAALKTDLHNPVTLGATPNGLSLATQVLSLGLASAGVTGALLGADWTTFNNKQATLVSGTNIKTVNGNSLLGSGDITISAGGGGSVTSVAALTLTTAGTDVTSTVANSTTNPVITLNLPSSNASNRGLLTASDWTIFNNKQNAIGYITANDSLVVHLSGTETISGTKSFTSSFFNIGSIDGTTGLGFITQPTGNKATEMLFYSDATNNNTANSGIFRKNGHINLRSNGISYSMGFNGSSLTNYRTLTVQDKDGTIAIDSDVMHLAGLETFTGSKIFTVSGSSAPALDITNNINGGTSYGFIMRNGGSGRGITVDNSVGGSGVYVNNMTAGNGFYSTTGGAGNSYYGYNSTAGQSFYSQIAGTAVGYYLFSQSTGVGVAIDNTSTGVGLRINSSGGSTRPFQYQQTGTERTYIAADGSLNFASTGNSIYVTSQGGADIAKFINSDTVGNGNSTVHAEVNCNTNLNYCFQAPIRGSRGNAFQSSTTTGQDELLFLLNQNNTITHLPVARFKHAKGIGLQIETGDDASHTYDSQYVYHGPLATGNAYKYTFNGVDKAWLNNNGEWTAQKFQTVGGNNSQVVLGDGTLGTYNLGTVTRVSMNIGTTGTDVNASVTNPNVDPQINLNIPNASAANRGVLSPTDWQTFNNKQSALVSGTNIKTINGNSILGSGDLVISGGITGSGTVGKIAKFTPSSGAIGNSILTENVNTVTCAGNLTSYNILVGTSNVSADGNLVYDMNTGGGAINYWATAFASNRTVNLDNFASGMSFRMFIKNLSASDRNINFQVRKNTTDAYSPVELSRGYPNPVTGSTIVGANNGVSYVEFHNMGNSFAGFIN